jgi:hypothetical protein
VVWERIWVCPIESGQSKPLRSLPGTKPTFGNTAGRPDRWSSTFEWVANENDPNGSWATSRASSKVIGYGAYDHVGGAGIVHAACWAHARRKFFEAVKLNPRDQTSIRIVTQMDELFAIDENARKENLNPSDRHLLRLEKAKPLLEQIKTAIQAARGDALPK